MAGNFGLALPLADAQVADGGGREELVAALYKAGLHHTLARYLGAGAGEVRGAGGGASRREEEVQQECAWRLQQWDRLSPDTAQASVPGCVLGALEGAVRGDGGAVAYWRKAGEGLVGGEGWRSGRAGGGRRAGGGAGGRNRIAGKHAGILAVPGAFVRSRVD